MTTKEHGESCSHLEEVKVENSCERLDRYGAVASFICAVHCLLTSVAFSLLSVTGLGWLGSPATDLVFGVIAITVGAFAIRNGYRHHKSYLPAILFGLGLFMVFLSHFVFGHSHGTEHSHVGHSHSNFEHICSSVLAVCGGLTLVSFHLVNARLQKNAGKKRCCH